MTREEAIKRLETHIAYHQSGAWPFTKTDEAMEMAIAALREQDSLAKKTSDKKTSDKKTSEWISVEERLPEEALVGKYIIVCIKNRWNEQRVDTVHWWGPERMHGAAWFWSDVTHWMPLPEPPEVEV